MAVNDAPCNWLWSLGQGLYAPVSLGAQRCHDWSTFTFTARQMDSMVRPNVEFGFHHRQSASRGLWGWQKNGQQAIGKSRRDGTSQIHLVAAICMDALVWRLSPAQAGDGAEGHQLIEAIGVQDAAVHLLTDSAYGVNGLCAGAL